MNNWIINLTFHGIGDPLRPLSNEDRHVWIDSDMFERMLDYLNDKEDFTISFDDGNVSDVSIAMPTLIKHGLNAHFFICGGLIDQPGFLSREQVRDIADSGMIIGNHGMHHRPWQGLGETHLHQELVQPKDLLEQITQATVTKASCPFGSYDRRILNRLRKAGYERIYTSDRGVAQPSTWLQPRNTILKLDNLYTLKNILSAKPIGFSALFTLLKLAIKSHV